MTTKEKMIEKGEKRHEGQKTNNKNNCNVTGVVCNMFGKW